MKGYFSNNTHRL